MIFRYTHFSLAILSTIGMAAWGCGDKKNDKTKASETKTKVSEVVGLDAIPASASAVIGFDIEKLVKSPLVQRAVEQMFVRDPQLKSELFRVLAGCDFDLKQDLSRAIIALIPTKIPTGLSAKAEAGQTDALLLAKGRFSENKMSACLGRIFAEDGGRLETSEFEGRNIYHQVVLDEGSRVAEQGLWLSFGGQDTIVIATSKDAMVLSLGKGDKLSGAKGGLAGIFTKVQINSAMWGIGILSESVAHGLVEATGGQVEAAKTILGSADFEAGLSLSLQVEMNEEKDAKILISQASLQVKAAALVLQSGGIGPLVNKITFHSEGKWAQLAWQLSEEELAKLMGANMAGLALNIDKRGANEQNPAPKSEAESVQENGKRHSNSNNEKDLREQRQAP